MGRIGVLEIILIVLVIIILFGPKKLPEIGTALGRAIKEFRKASQGIKEDMEETMEDKDHGNKTPGA